MASFYTLAEPLATMEEVTALVERIAPRLPDFTPLAGPFEYFFHPFGPQAVLPERREATGLNIDSVKIGGVFGAKPVTPENLAGFLEYGFRVQREVPTVFLHVNARVPVPKDSPAGDALFLMSDCGEISTRYEQSIGTEKSHEAFYAKLQQAVDGLGGWTRIESGEDGYWYFFEGRKRLNDSNISFFLDERDPALLAERFVKVAREMDGAAAARFEWELRASVPNTPGAETVRRFYDFMQRQPPAGVRCTELEMRFTVAHYTDLAPLRVFINGKSRNNLILGQIATASLARRRDVAVCVLLAPEGFYPAFDFWMKPSVDLETYARDRLGLTVIPAKTLDYWNSYPTNWRLK